MGEGMAVGVAMTAGQGDSQAFMVKAHTTDVSIDAGADWRAGAGFVSASAGAGFASFGDYKRALLFGPMTADRNELSADAYSAQIQAGWDHAMGNWTVTPLARLSYVNAKMTGFNELGTIATIGFNDREVNATSAAVELHARGHVSESVGLDAVLGYEGVISGKEGDLKGQLLNNTALPFIDTMGKVGSPGVLAGIGVNANFSGFAVALKYRGTFGSQSQRDQAGMLSFSRKF